MVGFVLLIHQSSTQPSGWVRIETICFRTIMPRSRKNRLQELPLGSGDLRMGFILRAFRNLVFPHQAVQGNGSQILKCEWLNLLQGVPFSQPCYAAFPFGISLSISGCLSSNRSNVSVDLGGRAAPDSYRLKALCPPPNMSPACFCVRPSFFRIRRTANRTVLHRSISP